LNTWVPDPEPERNPASEELVRKFVAAWGPPVPEGAGDVVLQNFELQCEAFLELEPTAVSSIMGVLPAQYVSRLKERRIAWFATATTLHEARMARDAGADAIIAQGYEAGATADRSIRQPPNGRAPACLRSSPSWPTSSTCRLSPPAVSATAGVWRRP
jgi:hypothetical protein